ncbi:MAG: YcxB family protein [Bacteroidetes bacterium]|nr:MAG: YcxB family protein [Bacteroidota bacterium]
MKITFDLKSSDFLTFQLYASSQSESIQQKRRRGRIFLSLGALLVSLFFYIGNSLLLSVFFLLFAVATYVFYPRYFKKRYYQHYQKYIRDHYEARLNVEQEVEINKDHLLLKDKTGEAKILLKEVDEIIETSEHFFIKISTGVSLILPKDRVPVEEVRTALESLELTIRDHTDWQW